MPRQLNQAEVLHRFTMGQQELVSRVKQKSRRNRASGGQHEAVVPAALQVGQGAELPAAGASRFGDLAEVVLLVPDQRHRIIVKVRSDDRARGICCVGVRLYFEIIDVFEDVVRASPALRRYASQLFGGIVIEHRASKAPGKVIALGLGGHFRVDRDETEMDFGEVSLRQGLVDLFEM